MSIYAPFSLHCMVALCFQVTEHTNGHLASKAGHCNSAFLVQPSTDVIKQQPRMFTTSRSNMYEYFATKSTGMIPQSGDKVSCAGKSLSCEVIGSSTKTASSSSLSVNNVSACVSPSGSPVSPTSPYIEMAEGVGNSNTKSQDGQTVRSSDGDTSNPGRKKRKRLRIDGDVDWKKVGATSTTVSVPSHKRRKRSVSSSDNNECCPRSRLGTDQGTAEPRSPVVPEKLAANHLEGCAGEKKAGKSVSFCLSDNKVFIIPAREHRSVKSSIATKLLVKRNSLMCGLAIPAKTVLLIDKSKTRSDPVSLISCGRRKKRKKSKQNVVVTDTNNAVELSTRTPSVKMSKKKRMNNDVEERLENDGSGHDVELATKIRSDNIVGKETVADSNNKLHNEARLISKLTRKARKLNARLRGKKISHKLMPKDASADKEQSSNNTASPAAKCSNNTASPAAKCSNNTASPAAKCSNNTASPAAKCSKKKRPHSEKRMEYSNHLKNPVHCVNAEVIGTPELKHSPQSMDNSVSELNKTLQDACRPESEAVSYVKKLVSSEVISEGEASIKKGMVTTSRNADCVSINEHLATKRSSMKGDELLIKNFSLKSVANDFFRGSNLGLITGYGC